MHNRSHYGLGTRLRILRFVLPASSNPDTLTLVNTLYIHYAYDDNDEQARIQEGG